MRLNASCLFAPLLTCTLKAVKNMVAMVSVLSPASVCLLCALHANTPPPSSSHVAQHLYALSVLSPTPCRTVLFTGLFVFFFFHCQFLGCFGDFACLEIYSSSSRGPEMNISFINREKGKCGDGARFHFLPRYVRLTKVSLFQGL